MWYSESLADRIVCNPSCSVWGSIQLNALRWLISGMNIGCRFWATPDIMTVCPSGLRGWTQVPLAQAAWVQIPQLSVSCSRVDFGSDTKRLHRLSSQGKGDVPHDAHEPHSRRHHAELSSRKIDCPPVPITDDAAWLLGGNISSKAGTQVSSGRDLFTHPCPPS